MTSSSLLSAIAHVDDPKTRQQTNDCTPTPQKNNSNNNSKPKTNVAVRYVPAKQKSRNTDTRVSKFAWIVVYYGDHTMSVACLCAIGCQKQRVWNIGLDRGLWIGLDRSGSVWIASLDHLDRLWVLGVGPDLEFWLPAFIYQYNNKGCMLGVVKEDML